VTHGQAVTAQLSFANLPSGAVTLANCYNLPADVNCSYNGTSGKLTMTTGTGAATGTYQILVVSTVNPKTTASVSSHSRNIEVCLFGLPLGLMFVGRRRRRWLCSGVGILGLCLFLVVGCSSGSPSPSTTVTSQASTTLTLTLN
jgi:hypothetical protein